MAEAATPRLRRWRQLWGCWCFRRGCIDHFCCDWDSLFAAVVDVTNDVFNFPSCAPQSHLFREASEWFIGDKENPYRPYRCFGRTVGGLICTG